MKKITKCIKKTWNNDYRDILVPIISIAIFIIALLTIRFIKALIICILINAVYFIINSFFKKRKAKINAKRKQTKSSNNNKNNKNENSSTNNKNSNNNKKNNSNNNKTINSSKNGKVIKGKVEEKINMKNKNKKKKVKKWKIALLILLGLFIVVVISIIGFLIYIVIKAPKFDENNLYVSEPSVILDKDGNEIAKLGSEKRILVTYDEIPEVLIDAIIATEDSRFFEHKGVDWARFLKASSYQLLGKSEAGGASTLTMQVSKNAYTSTEDEGIQGIIRKFTDLYISMFVIEKNYTKEQIMEFYVNSQWLAKNTYGVEQTALTYFGKSAKDLNVSEAAMIAGLFQAPGKYDPYKNPEATERRRQTVLKLMLRHGYISKNEYNIAKKLTVEKIVIPKEESIYSAAEVSEYQTFIDTVVDEVKEKTGKNPYNTSMIIYTTMNTDFQDYINDIMNGVTYEWPDDYAQAGIAVISVDDGSISAIGGGRNVDIIDSYNYATEIENQIGSTAKPLYDYGPAIEYNNWSSYQILVDEPTTYSDGTSINNWNGTYEGFETMRTALRGSRNIPALKAFKKNDKAKVIEFVTNLGLTPEIYSCDEGYKRDKKKCINMENPENIVDAKKASTLHEAHAIGGYNGESPLTMSAAYSAFARGGIYIEPYSFTKLIYQDTGEEYINDIKKTKAMSEETAYMISDMLKGTAPYALGGYYNINGIKYAAKTGTTNYDEKTMKAHNMPNGAVNDYWTIGYNKKYAIGIWCGYDSISNEYYNSLNKAPHARLFQAVGKKIFTDNADFNKPSGVVAVEVESGCPEPTLPSEFTPSDQRQTELFIKGTEPTTVSTRFAKLSDVSNLKANVNDNIITLTWSGVDTPKINTQSYLKDYFKPVFENSGFLQSYINNRLNYNENYIGNIEYNIYIKDSSGSEKLLDHTSSTRFETEIDVAGEYTFTVKTTYSIFKANMSDGKSIKATISTSPIIPDDSENQDGDNNNIEIIVDPEDQNNSDNN